MSSFAIEADNQIWLHVSFSKRDEIPSYEDQAFIKKWFIGEDKLALQILPPRDQHVNIHPNCLHLWSPMESNPIPDFRKLGMI